MCSSSFFRYLKVADVIQYRSLSLFMPEFHFVCFFSCEHYVLALFRIMFPLLRRLISFLIYNNVCFFVRFTCYQQSVRSQSLVENKECVSSMFL